MADWMCNGFVFVVSCVMREPGSVSYQFARNVLAKRSYNVGFLRNIACTFSS
jgi:hypothetical protein